MRKFYILLSLLIFTACQGRETSNEGNWRTYENEQYGISFQYPSDWEVNELDASEQLGPILTVSTQENGGVGFTIYSNFNGGFECFSVVETIILSLKSGESINGTVQNPSGNSECNSTDEDSEERMVLVNLPYNLLMIYRFNQTEYPDGLNLLDGLVSTFDLSETPQNNFIANTEKAEITFENLDECDAYQAKAENIGDMFTRMAGYVYVVEKIFYSELKNSCLATVEGTMLKEHSGEYSTRFELLDLSSDRDFGETLLQMYGCIPRGDCGSNKTPEETRMEFYSQVEAYH